jgi:RNA polymerase sigma-70 factor, ECF subfamily
VPASTVRADHDDHIDNETPVSIGQALVIGGSGEVGCATVAALAAAVGRDDTAYAALVEPHRRLLFAHCYRMLGSIQDAEDAAQETFLRAWRKLSSFEGRSALRSWLYSIATNVCLRAIERRPRRLLPIDCGPSQHPHGRLAAPLSGSAWIELLAHEQVVRDRELAGPDARYEQRESVELAFIAAFQHLPPRQRAVLILKDVLGFSGDEIADALETNAAAVYSVLQRARENVEQRLPERSQQMTLKGLGDARLSELVERCVQAWERQDVDALAALLTDAVTLAMPPTPTRFRGRSAVSESWAPSIPDRCRSGLRAGDAAPRPAQALRVGELRLHEDRELTLQCL